MARVHPAVCDASQPIPKSPSVLAFAMVEVPEEERMVVWLGLAARDYRQSAGAVRSQVAGAVAADQSTVQRFEDGHGWPTKVGIDEMLDAYVRTCGLGSTREIWRRALALWETATEAEGATATGARDALKRLRADVRQQRQLDQKRTARESDGGRKKRGGGRAGGASSG